MRGALPFLAVLALNVSAQETDPDLILIGEDDDNYYYMKKADYFGSAAEKSAQQYARAKKALEADQAAIKHLGFAVDAERFKLLEDTGSEQHAAARRKLLDLAFDKSLSAAQAAAKSAKSLNPWNVNTAIKALEDKGFKSKAVADALRAIARTKDKPAMQQAFDEFVREIKALKKAWAAVDGAAKNPHEAELRLALGALKILQGNPVLGLWVTGAECLESMVYLGYLHFEVEALETATEDKLKHLDDLAARLKGHVKEMNDAKAAWRKATGHASGTPVLR